MAVQPGHVFRGIVFTGVMITPRGPKAPEYNVRSGGPELQSLIPLLDARHQPGRHLCELHEWKPL